jgi:hypothetical protein
VPGSSQCHSYLPASEWRSSSCTATGRAGGLAPADDGACGRLRMQEAQRLQKWALFEQREAVRLQAKEEKAAAREAAKEERLARKAAERAAKQAALQQKKDLTRKCAPPLLLLTPSCVRLAHTGLSDCSRTVACHCMRRWLHALPCWFEDLPAT